jgi:hypothetical protein
MARFLVYGIAAESLGAAISYAIARDWRAAIYWAAACAIAATQAR